MQKVFRMVDEYYDRMVEIRRYLHKHPEVSFKEYKTAKYIAGFYKKLNIDVQTNVGGNGVVARIKGKKNGKTVALRADFDALPIQDEKDAPYKSTVPGVMHACGHDGHTAVLLTIAKILHELRDELPGEYVLIHQHAEEIAPGGAKSMIEDGCLDGVDAIFGTHLWATEPLGQILYRTGPVMAAADRFTITIKGKGGHGAYPHLSRDPVVCASQLVINLQKIVSRHVNPVKAAVVSVGKFIAGSTFNAIPDTVELEGTVRTFDQNVRNQIEQEMERMIKGTCYSHDCDYTFRYYRGYPPVVNHEEETRFLAEIAKKIPGVTKVAEGEQRMIGEDFAYYLQRVKGTFFFTGAKPDDDEKTFPHHHPKFDFNEKAMKIAAKTLLTAAIQYQHH